MQLPLASGPVAVNGRVMHVEKSYTGDNSIYTHGVQFGELPLETRDAIELHCTHHSVPMWRMKYRQSMNLFSKAAEKVGNVRDEKRYHVQLPARVFIEAEDGAPPAEGIALLEDVSATGARLLMEVPVPPNRVVTFDVPGTNFSGKGRVVFNRTLETPMKIRFVVGLGRQVRGSRRKAWNREWRGMALRAVDNEATQ
jgi:hypothetical protein